MEERHKFTIMQGVGTHRVDWCDILPEGLVNIINDALLDLSYDELKKLFGIEITDLGDGHSVVKITINGNIKYESTNPKQETV